MMADHSAEKILERRRIRNREAQRRFREKKLHQKTSDFLQLNGHLYETLDNLHGPSLPLSPSPPDASRTSTDTATSPDTWVPIATNPLATDIDELDEYTSNTLDYYTSQLSTFGTPRCGTITSGTTDSSNSTYDSCIVASTQQQLSASETSPSPRDVYSEACCTELTPFIPKPGSSKECDSGGWLSPLHMAAKRGSARIIGMLLQHSSDCNEPDSEGLTPLIYAVIGGYEEATRLLLEHGARIGDVPHNKSQEQQPPRATAIHWAVLNRRERVLRVLLNHCTDSESSSIDRKDHQGRAALHIAIDIEFDAGVSLLLQYGANPIQKAPRQREQKSNCIYLEHTDQLGYLSPD